MPSLHICRRNFLFFFQLFYYYNYLNSVTIIITIKIKSIKYPNYLKEPKLLYTKTFYEKEDGTNASVKYFYIDSVLKLIVKYFTLLINHIASYI